MTTTFLVHTPFSDLFTREKFFIVKLYLQIKLDYNMKYNASFEIKVLTTQQ